MADNAILKGLGGMMVGVGEGMVQQGKEKRALALEALRQNREDDRAKASMIFKSSEAQKARAFDASESEKDRSFRETAQMREIAAKFAGKGGFDADDKRLVDLLVERHTTDDGLAKSTDWEAVAKDLKKRGRGDLAGYIEPASGDVQGVDLESPEWAKAETMAAKWVAEQAGLFSADSSDFKGYGGNREEAKQQKALEIYGRLTGKSPPNTMEAGAPEMDSSAWVEGAAPAGTKTPETEQGRGAPKSAKAQPAGSKDDPYKPTTMDDLAKIPKGGIYLNPADGKLYRKN